MNKSKVILAGAVMVVLILIASFSAMSIVQSRTVGNVEKSEITEVKADSASLKWKRVSSADGYYVYQSPAGENAFERIATVKGEATVKYTVDKLEQATAYDFYVTAFKDSNNKDLNNSSYAWTPAGDGISVTSFPKEGVYKLTLEAKVCNWNNQKRKKECPVNVVKKVDSCDPK